MKDRNDIKTFILDLEQRFPVNNWKCGTIHLWPIIRIRLFFYLIDRIENSSAGRLEGRSKALTIRDHFRGILLAGYHFFWMLSRPRRDFVFAGANAHYVSHDGLLFNRFFDPWLRDGALRARSSVFLYDSSAAAGRFNQSGIVSYNRSLEGYLYLRRVFTSKKPQFSLDGYDKFLDYLRTDDIAGDFALLFSQQNLERTIGQELIGRIAFFRDLWKKTGTKRLAILCYYGSWDAYAMVAAANQLAIPTAELQHGPQTDIHLCYGNWNNIPSTGYDVLPRTFWCWDDDTAGVMNRWAGNTLQYSATTIGNPWVNYWKDKSAYAHHGFVLYTLQPAPLTMEMLFPPQLAEIIKNDDRRWYIRLHPRQLREVDAIRDYVSTLGLSENVEIDRGTADPLPLLLSNAALHITHFSGSVIEASQLGTPTILLHPTALASFPEIIARGAAWYLDIRNPDFKSEFLLLRERLRDGHNIVLNAPSRNPYADEFI